MNTYELDTKTLQALNLEVSDENRGKFSSIFLSAYNIAYLDICRNYLKPTVWEEITLNNRCFSLSDLTKEPVEILKVSIYRDFDTDMELSEQQCFEFRELETGVLVVPGMVNYTQCWVKYEYLPELLVNDTPTVSEGNTSEPTLIIGATKQIALSYYAAHMYYASLKKPSSAEYNYNLYLRICQSLKGKLAPGTPTRYQYTYDI